jgi:hypothetical protein
MIDGQPARADDVGPAVDPHHDRELGGVRLGLGLGLGRPDIEIETILAHGTGIAPADLDFGFAPAEVQSAWKQKACTTTPRDSRKSDLCQEMSDRYGIVAGSTFGSADADVLKSWTELSCKTNKPSIK